MKLTKKILAAFSFFILVISASSFAQCNAFTKKKCMPGLSPYVHNGQLNSAALNAGETAELELTFYSGQEYRVLICAQEILGDVYYKLKDKNNKVVYDSKEQRSNTFDFNVKSTQQLMLEVIVPASNAPNKLNINGCVSVLIGFKK
jgi:hypothetical protein